MMTGNVSFLHPLMPVTFRLENSPDITLEFVVDTGFTGMLALPSEAVASLKLPYIGEQSANLANDAEVRLSLHAATILWHGVEREVRLLVTGRRPLLGTALMNGDELLVQFVETGLLTLDPI